MAHKKTTLADVIFWLIFSLCVIGFWIAVAANGGL
jgi:hypothetical protein